MDESVLIGKNNGDSGPAGPFSDRRGFWTCVYVAAVSSGDSHLASCISAADCPSIMMIGRTLAGVLTDGCDPPLRRPGRFLPQMAVVPALGFTPVEPDRAGFVE